MKEKIKIPEGTPEVIKKVEPLEIERVIIEEIPQRGDRMPITTYEIKPAGRNFSEDELHEISVALPIVASKGYLIENNKLLYRFQGAIGSAQELKDHVWLVARGLKKEVATKEKYFDGKEQERVISSKGMKNLD